MSKFYIRLKVEKIVPLSLGSVSEEPSCPTPDIKKDGTVDLNFRIFDLVSSALKAKIILNLILCRCCCGAGRGR